MVDVKSTLTETLRAHRQSPEAHGWISCACDGNFGRYTCITWERHVVDALAVAMKPEPLPQPCVVDGCDFEWVTYDELNNHSEANHLEPNPFEAGGWRFPGADHVGDFTWHPVTVTVQRVVSEGETHPEDEQLRHVTNNPTHPRTSGDPR